MTPEEQKAQVQKAVAEALAGSRNAVAWRWALLCALLYLLLSGPCAALERFLDELSKGAATVNAKNALVLKQYEEGGVRFAER